MSMTYDLSLSNYYYGFRNAHDDDVLVSSDDRNDLVGIADSPEFRLWAINAGFQYFGIWRDGIGYWQALGNPVHLAVKLAPLTWNHSRPLAASR
jgi:hypothetical protein